MSRCTTTFRSIAFLCAFAAVSVHAADEYVFTAPPRGAGGTEADIYEPVAEYLSKAIGKKVVYKHSDNWLTYQNGMQKGKYDLIFDGPQFISWRALKINHEPLAKLPGKLAFVVVVRKQDDKIQTLKDLAGRTVCGLAPPNLATLSMQAQFDNPARQPLVVESKSFEDGYKAMLEGKKCVAAVLRDKMFEKLSKENDVAREIWRSQGVANQGFTAGPRLSADERGKLRAALTAPEARAKLKGFFDRYNKDKDLVAANADEYVGLAVLLKDIYGFDMAQSGAAEAKKKN